MSGPTTVLIIAWSLAGFAYAQDSSRVYVLDRIIVEGNSITKPYVITRELPFKQHDTVSSAKIEEGRKKLVDTGLFTDVLTQNEPVGGDTIDLLIYVREKWYIWPYPVAGFRDRDWSKFYAGAGAVDLNFRGAAERLAFAFALGYDPFVGVIYRNPAVGNDKRYLFGIGGSYSRGSNFGLESGFSNGEYNDDFGSIYIEGGRRLGEHVTATAQLGYNYVGANSTEYSGLVVSPTGKDIFSSLKLRYVYDDRDFISYASSGMRTDIEYEKFGLGESQVNFARFAFDLRNYFEVISPIVAAVRIHGNLAEGPVIPPYDLVYYGYYERIRGMFNDTLVGESLAGANVEIRIPLIKELVINFPFEILKQYISNRIGIYWTFFGDAGETSGKSLEMSLHRLVYGYGGGLSLALPYNIVIQADYARGSDGHWEFILDFGETI